jgi:hypothetical protein
MNILANGRAIRVNNMLTTLPIPCAHREIAHLGKRLMPFFRNPLLVVWEAMNLLAEEDALSRCASDKSIDHGCRNGAVSINNGVGDRAEHPAINMHLSLAKSCSSDRITATLPLLKKAENLV